MVKTSTGKKFLFNSELLFQCVEILISNNICGQFLKFFNMLVVPTPNAYSVSSLKFRQTSANFSNEIYLWLNHNPELRSIKDSFTVMWVGRGANSTQYFVYIPFWNDDNKSY